MSDNILDYKCPSCSASLTFNAQTQKLHCASCSTEYTLEEIQSLNDAESKSGTHYDWDTYTPRDFSEAEKINLSSYSCPSCSALVTGDENLGATVCPYCGSANIIKKQFEGVLRPDYVIPFKVDKKAAMKAFEQAALKAPFLPEEFKSKKKIEEMAGVYVPFWMFDCDCKADMTYSAQRIFTWSDANYTYTKTDYYCLVRKGNIAFCNLPVDGSQKVDNVYTEALEPYDYSAAVDFNTAYLSGYLADKYDTDAEECKLRANERIKNSTEAEFLNTTRGFVSVMPRTSSIASCNGKIRYALLPVWFLNFSYKDEVYKYAINGQTGKTVGIFPICKKKRNRFFLKVFLITLAIVLLAISAYYFLA